MAKPAGPDCNLACGYCYYLEKSRLMKESGRHMMDDTTLELFIRQYIEAQPGDDVSFTWHGGEPMMRNLDFYRKVMDLQRKYADGKRIFNSLQTNATLLNEEWCRFLRDNNWLVGVSIDGPQTVHDANRRDKGGKPTFLRVMKGIQLLNRFGVEWNGMATVNASNVGDPIGFYRFFKDIGCRYIQFTPIVERKDEYGRLIPGYRNGGRMTDESVTPGAWGEFLISIFDEWIMNDVGEYFIQIFESTLASWMGLEPGLCVLSSHCGHAAVMEHDGDLYSCDHFVFPQYRLGNIRETPLLELMLSEKQTEFSKAKGTGLPTECKECEFLFACNGECPRNRFSLQNDANSNQKSYLCEGYRRFFRHVAPYMEQLKQELSDS